MHPLLKSSIEAHGGLSRCSAFEVLRARMTVRGEIFEVKRIGGFQEDVTYETRLREERVTIEGFGGCDRRLRFLPNLLVWETHDGTVLASRDHPRESFRGHGAGSAWDALHLGYFTGYALWTYLNLPFLYAGATVVVFARNQEKLTIAKERGADCIINTRGKSLSDLRNELVRLTGKAKLDAAIDCVGAVETIQTGFGLLATAGALVSVGLVGNRIDIPLFPFTAGEFTYHGSFWANYSDLQEVLELAQQGKIQHSIKPIRFQDINENLEMLRRGDIIGRAVIVFDIKADTPDHKVGKDMVSV